jgi:hypothetical protein
VSLFTTKDGGIMTDSAGSLTDRMIGAALLNIETYEAVEADQTATAQAALVVILVAACEAIGSWSGGLFAATSAAVASLIAWLVWAGVTYVIGDKIFGGEATWGELLRTIGFAQAPGVLFLLGIVPLLGGLVSGVVSIWIVVAGFIAIRQALDIGNLKTFFTVLIGGIVYGILHNLPLTPF